MPAARASSQVMFILTTIFHPSKTSIGWDTPSVLDKLDIDHRPSVDPTAPIPTGLSRVSSTAIAGFIDQAAATPIDHRMAFINSREADDYATGRTAWQAWYKARIATTLNTAVDFFWKHNEHCPWDLMKETEVDEFPDTDTLASMKNAGPEIFGACVANGNVSFASAQPMVKSFMVHNVARVKKAYKRALNLMDGTEEAPGFWRRLTEAMKQVTDTQEVGSELKTISMLMQKAELYITYTPDRADELTNIKNFWLTFCEAQGLSPAMKERPSARKKYTKEVETRMAETVEKAKTIRWAPADLATEAQQEEALAHLVHHFEARGTTDFESLEELLDAQTMELWESQLGNEELGVETVRGLTPTQLNDLLGYVDERPALFAKWISKEPTESSWDATTPAQKARWDKGGEGLEPLKLKWHQMCGVASIMQRMWVKEGARDCAKHVLLADDVGIGKTAQIMASIAFVIDAHLAEKAGKNPPPLVSQDDRRSFMGRGSVPDLPHLLIVPNSVVRQWHRELKAFFASHVIDIFELPVNASAADKFFVDPKGPWKKSEAPLIRRVVLCPHSAFTTFTGNRFTTTARGGTPVDDPYPVRTEGYALGSRGVGTEVGLTTVFGQSWCFGVVDEVHDFRVTTNKGFLGVLELERICHAIFLASGTPLVSGPRDLINIGRMLKVEALSGWRGLEFERDHNRVIRKAQRDSKKPEERARALNSIQELMKKGENLDHTLDKDCNPAFPVTAERYLCVRVIRQHLAPHMIRRTIESKTWEGQPINDLKEKKMVNYLVELSEKEMGLLTDELHLMTKESKPTFVYNFEGFLSRYRLSLVHPTVPTNTSVLRNFPIFRTKEEYDANPSSKITSLVRIINHHLADDDAPPLCTYDPNTNLMMASPSPSPAPESRQASEHPEGEPVAPATQTKKILVYFHFSQTAGTLQSALEVHGIKVAIITGNQPVKKRDSILQKWRRTPSLRVLLFSAVGTTGHNMADASIVIHFDQNWSSIINNQIDGRAWRYGQKHQVLIYHILAMGTTDTLMHSMANEKDAMLKALVSKKDEAVFMALKSSEPDVEDEDEEDTPGPSSSRPKKRKAAPKRKVSKVKPAASAKGKEKAPPVTDDDDDETAESNDEGDDGAVKTPISKVAGKSKASAKKPPAVGEERGGDDDLDANTTDKPVARKRSSKAKPKRKGDGKRKVSADEGQGSKGGEAAENGEDNDAHDAPDPIVPLNTPAKVLKGKGGRKTKAKPAADDTNANDIPVAPTKPSKAKPVSKGAGKGKAKKRVADDDNEQDEQRQTAATKGGKGRKIPKSRPTITDEEDDAEINASSAVKGPPAAVAKDGSSGAVENQEMGMQSGMTSAANTGDVDMHDGTDAGKNSPPPHDLKRKRSRVGEEDEPPAKEPRRDQDLMQVDAIDAQAAAQPTHSGSPVDSPGHAADLNATSTGAAPQPVGAALHHVDTKLASDNGGPTSPTMNAPILNADQDSPEGSNVPTTPPPSTPIARRTRSASNASASRSNNPNRGGSKPEVAAIPEVEEPAMLTGTKAAQQPEATTSLDTGDTPEALALARLKMSD